MTTPGHLRAVEKMEGRRTFLFLRAMIRASHDPKPPSRGDDPARCDARNLWATRGRIRNRLLGAIHLPVLIHAGYCPHDLGCETAFSG